MFTVVPIKRALIIRPTTTLARGSGRVTEPLGEPPPTNASRIASSENSTLQRPIIKGQEKKGGERNPSYSYNVLTTVYIPHRGESLERKQQACARARACTRRHKCKIKPERLRLRVPPSHVFAARESPREIVEKRIVRAFQRE